MEKNRQREGDSSGRHRDKGGRRGEAGGCESKRDERGERVAAGHMAAGAQIGMVCREQETRGGNRARGEGRKSGHGKGKRARWEGRDVRGHGGEGRKGQKRKKE